MLRFFVVAAGGAIGALLRYIVSGIGYRLSSSVLPISTLFINVIGSLGIGFLWGIFERFAISPNVRVFIFIGILGSYTTFSTFSLETFNLLRDGEYRIAFINVIFSVILSIGAVFMGYFSSKMLLDYYK
ncbi:MAG: fluoride efflux transporter CrcB [Candidatus Omnitrophica bacterium]|nr:fluoride efflux transporter CrcB [Candidatus Omnitrophota bacterium]